MATEDELADEIVWIIHDPEVERTISERMIGACNFLASRILFPGLEATDTIATLDTQNTAALPSDFMRNLFYAENEDGEEIKVFNNLSLLLRAPWGLSPADKGSIYGVTINGSNLFYSQRDIDVITIRYHRKPSDTSVEDFFLDIAYDAILQCVCWKAYSVIEQGMDGVKEQTKYYKGMLDTSIADIRTLLRQGVSLPPAPVVTGNFL
jgi:hypothetical protein